MALRLKANRRFPSIPVVVDTPENHTQVLMAVKEALDIGQRRTGDLFNSFIRVEDLIDLGLITIEGNTNAIVGADLSEIADIGDLSGAAAGDFLRFDGSVWINDQLATGDITQPMVTQHQDALSIAYSQVTGAPTVPEELDDLTDVDLSSPPSANDVLTWDGIEWVAAPVPPGGAIYLDDILDVDALYPNPGDVLTWDGYDWVNEAPAEASGGGYPPDNPPATADAMDDEFDTGSLDAQWTWFDQGTSAITFLHGSILRLLGPVEAGVHLRGITQPHTGPARYRMKATGINPNNFNLGGIVFRNSANGRLLVFSASRTGSTFSADYFTDATTYNSSPLGGTPRSTYTVPAATGWMYLEIEDDGTNLIGRVSGTGLDVDFTQVFSVTRAAFLGTPDQIGLMVNTQSGSTPGTLLVDWFRRMA